jgi:putative ABC transport system permease protein
MTWQFVGGSVVKEPAKRKQTDNMFLFALDPRKIRMMDEIDALSDADVQKIIDNEKGILMGRERLAMIDKKIGDRITLYSFNYKDIELEFDIVGYLPDGRYAQNVIMNREYLLKAMKKYEQDTRKPHPMSDKTLGIFWFQVKNVESIDKIAQHLEKSGRFTNPALKVETASSGIATFIEPYRDMLTAMRWFLTPAILVVLALVIANSISISVRERRTEMAVLKVLGFRPNQILALVLGEVLLIGVGTGLLCATVSYFGVWLMGGINFRVAFFPVFFIPVDVFWWGTGVGAVTALIGSIIPAWGARSVKVSEVFSKVA